MPADWGFSFLTDEELTACKDQPVSGVLIQCESDIGLIEQAFVARSQETPLLLLVFGDKAGRGFADRLHREMSAVRADMEVVRLFLFPGGEKAVIGGAADGYWTSVLRLHLARQKIISLLCRRVEVDEVACHLPLYLAWKKQFFQLLGEQCDQSKARIEVVAAALGMDKRIGQTWLPPGSEESLEDRYLPGWLKRQWQYVTKKTNIRRVALWGTIDLVSSIMPDLARDREIALYLTGSVQKTNELVCGGRVHAKPEETLDEADLLLIVGADPLVTQISLHELTNRMRQPIVIDACCCYPLQEMEEYGIKYRTYGQNTNVWEWN